MFGQVVEERFVRQMAARSFEGLERRLDGLQSFDQRRRLGYLGILALHGFPDGLGQGLPFHSCQLANGGVGGRVATVNSYRIHLLVYLSIPNEVSCVNAASVATGARGD